MNRAPGRVEEDAGADLQAGAEHGVGSEVRRGKRDGQVQPVRDTLEPETSLPVRRRPAGLSEQGGEHCS